MNTKNLRNILIAYLAILLVVIIIQIPKSDISADEPSYKVEIEEDSFKDAIIMNVNSPVVLIKEEQNLIDSKDVDIVPKVINNSTYVPVQFFKNVLGATITWEPTKKQTVVRYDNKAVIFTNKSKNVNIIDNDTDKIVEAVSEPVIVRNRMYVPLRISAESFGKYVIYKEGLIVISDKNVIVDTATLENLKKKTAGLPIVGTEENLEILLGKPENNSYMTVKEGVYLESADATDMANGYSSTNVQVQGVDEGDIVKTDGEYIYYIKNNNVEIVKAYPAEKMKNVAKISLENDENLSEIYLNGNQLILVGDTYIKRDLSVYERTTEETTEEYAEETTEENVICDDIEDINLYKREKFAVSFAKIYDISNKDKPILKKEFKSDGEYISSRVTNNSIYVVSKTFINALVYNDKYLPPIFYDSTAEVKQREIDFSDICYIPEKITKEYMTVAGADLTELSKDASVYTTIACGTDIYMSNNNLYIATSGDNTEIYKYKLNQGSVAYSAHGNVNGRLHNQFSMDENDGYFRITTTEYKNGEKSNSLYILDDKLDEYSSIKGIAPEENIYSTRFMGNRAYMVTFETVDPLFVIDVGDPKEPKILGALKIPGYSDYLHPYDENHLIGIGKDTFVYEDMAYYKGIKLSMFDVTDVENPKELFKEVIGDRGTSSEVLSNHKALLLDKEKNILGFPIQIMEIKDKENDNDDVFDYGEFDFQGFLRYSVDLEKGFVLESKTTHLTDEEMLKSGNYGGIYDKYIKRGIFINDYLYTISDKEIKAEKMVPLTSSANKEVACVEFD